MTIIKEFVALLIRYSGLPFLIRRFFCRKKVTIILYHDPKPEVLDRHFNYLIKHYNFISLPILIDALHEKDWSNIPENGLVVTIDDGNKDNYKLLNTFKKYQVRPTIYVCTDIIGTNRHFWFKDITPKEFKKLITQNHKKRLMILKNKYGFLQEKEYPDSERQSLSIQEMKEMLPFVDFQSHSKTHPSLTTCDDEDCWNEICDSKKHLEELLNKSCEHLSYPNGDYGEREESVCKKCGYRSARTVNIGWNDNNTDPYHLKIIFVGDNASITRLSAQMSAILSYLSYLLQYKNLQGIHKSVKLKENNK